MAKEKDYAEACKSKWAQARGMTRVERLRILQEMLADPAGGDVTKEFCKQMLSELVREGVSTTQPSPLGLRAAEQPAPPPSKHAAASRESEPPAPASESEPPTPPPSQQAAPTESGPPSSWSQLEVCAKMGWSLTEPTPSNSDTSSPWKPSPADTPSPEPSPAKRPGFEV